MLRFKLIILIVILLIADVLEAQTNIFNNGTKIVVEKNSTLFIPGNYENLQNIPGSDAPLYLNGTIKIHGNLDAGPTTLVNTDNSGQIQLTGETNQRIKGSEIFIPNLFLTKTEGVVIIDGILRIGKKIDLQTSGVDLDHSKIQLIDFDSEIKNETNKTRLFGLNGEIISPNDIVLSSGFISPNLNGLGIGIKLENDQSFNDVNISRFTDQLTGVGIDKSISRYFSFRSLTGGIVQNLTLRYFKNELISSYHEEKLTAFQSNDSGSTWKKIGSITNISQNQIECENVEISPAINTLLAIGYDCNQTSDNTPEISSNVNIENDQIHLCEGEIATLSFDGSATTYFWSQENNGIIEYDQPIAVSDEGLYTLTIRKPNGCEFSNQIEVKKHSIPKADFIINPAPSEKIFCKGAEISFVNNSTNSDGSPITKFQWDIEGQTQASSTVKHIFNDTGDQAIGLVVETKYCKSSVKSKSILILPDPVASFSIPKNNYCDQEEIIMENSSEFKFQNTNRAFKSVWTYNGNQHSGINQYTPNLKASENKLTLEVFPLDPAEGCYAVNEKQFQVHPNPVTSFKILDGVTEKSSVCKGNYLDLINESTISDSSNLTYTWKLPFYGSNEKNLNLQFIEEGVQQIKLITTTINGCTDSLLKVLEVHPVPTGNFSIDKRNICENDELKITNESEPFSDLSFDWNFGDGNSSNASAPNFSYKYDTPGIFELKLTRTNQFGCTNTIKKSVSVHSNPTIDFNVGDLCEKESIQFVNKSFVNNGSIDEVFWEFGDDSFSEEFNPQHTYSDPGSFNLTLSILSNEGCSDTLVREIFVHRLPSFNLGEFILACSDSVLLDPTIDENSFLEETSFLWYDNKNNLISDSESIYVNGSGAYYAELSNHFCENVIEVPVFLSKIPSLGEDREVCKDHLLTDQTEIESGSFNISYNWYRNGEIIESDADEIQLVQSGNYVVEKSTIVGNQACYSYDSLNIMIINSPQINLAENYEFCSGDTLKIEQNPKYTYQWENLLTNEVYSSSHIFSFYNESSTFQVKVSNNGCDTSSIFMVKKNPAPNTSFLLSDTIQCEGDFIEITNTSSSSNENDNLIYTWGVDGNMFLEKEQVVNVLGDPGRHIVSLTATDVNLCSTKVVKSVNTKEKPYIGFFAEADCQGNKIHFLNESEKQKKFNFQWSFGDGNSSFEVNPNHTYKSPGDYLVNLSVTNSACTESFTKNLEIFSKPILDLSDTIKSCGDQLIISFEEENTSYKWYYNHELISEAPEHQLTKSGDYKIIAVNDKGCLNEKVITLMLNSEPEINLPDSIYTCDSVILKAPKLPKAEYLWSTGHRESDLTVKSSGWYIIDLVDQNKCKAIDSVYVRLEETPNFDLGPDIYACNNDTIVITPNIPLNLTWSNGKKSSFIQLTKTEKVFASAAKEQCVFTDSVMVTFFEKPNAEFKIKNYCENEVIHFIPEENESASNRYRWKFGDGTFYYGYRKEKNYFNEGNYEVSLEVISSDGCKSRNVKPVRIYPVPNADFSFSGKCQNDEVAFKISEESEAFSFTWEFGDGTLSKEANPNHFYSKSGLFNVVLSVKDSNNCSNHSFQKIEIHPPPYVDLQRQVNSCQEKVVLDAGNHFFVQWSNGSNERYLTVKDEGEYSVIVSNEYGCTDIDTVYIETVTKPDLLPKDTSACGKMVLESAHEGFSYLWSNGSTDPYTEIFNSGQYALQLISKDLCIWNDTVDIIINEIPVIELGEDISACEGDTITVSAYHPIANKYLWSSGHVGEEIILTETGTISVEIYTEKNCRYIDELSVKFYPRPVFNFSDSIFACQFAEISTGLSNDISHLWSNGSNLNRITVENEGLYWVEAVNNFGCNYIDSVFLKVYPLPDIDLGDDLKLCHGNDTILEVSTKFEEISWSTGDSNKTLNIKSSGVYWVKIKDLNGCENSDTLSVEIEPPIQVGLKDLVYLCHDNQDITLETPFNFKKYRWYSSKGLETRRSRLTTSNPGKYWLVVENEKGCIASDTSMIKDTNQKIRASFLMPSIASLGDWVNFSLLTEPIPDKILWDFGDGASSTDIHPTYQYFREGDFEVTLKVENNTCTDKLTKFITIDENFVGDYQSSAAFTEILDSKIYPNPNNGKFLLKIMLSEKSSTRVAIFNLTGDKIYEKIVELKDDQIQIDISDQIPNNYLMIIQTGRNVLVKRVIKSK